MLPSLSSKAFWQVLRSLPERQGDEWRKQADELDTVKKKR